MIDNAKVQADIFDRRLYDAESFKQAGSGELQTHMVNPKGNNPEFLKHAFRKSEEDL